MDALITTLSVLVVSLPVIIVWVIGIALALLRWRRRPQVSLFALIAFTISIVNKDFFPPAPPTFGNGPREQNATP